MGMAFLLNTPEHHWVCLKCTETHITYEAQPHTPFHPCRGLKGLTTPFVPEGTTGKVEAVPREDYVGNELAQYDGDGVPIMAIVTTREDGQDCSVLAPTAVLRVQ